MTQDALNSTHSSDGSTRRRGARAARRKARRDGAGKGATTAIWPGIPGGKYKPLKDADVVAVHDTALRILTEVGMHDATPRCIEVITEAGGQLTKDGRFVNTARCLRIGSRDCRPWLQAVCSGSGT